MSNKKQTAMMELLSIIDGVLEYSHNPLLQQISDAGNKLLEKEREQHKTSYKKGAIFNAYSYHLLNGRGKWGNLPQAFNEYYSETYEK